MSLKHVHASHLGRAVKMGRRRPVARPLHLRLARYLRASLPPAPDACDYSPLAASALANIYGNDTLGDCVIAVVTTSSPSRREMPGISSRPLRSRSSPTTPPSVDTSPATHRPTRAATKRPRSTTGPRPASPTEPRFSDTWPSTRQTKPR